MRFRLYAAIIFIFFISGCFSGESGNMPLFPSSDTVSDTSDSGEGINSGDPSQTGEPVPEWQVCAPTFSPHPAMFSTEREISISTWTEGAEIYYTTDGSEPGPEDGTRYTEPFTLPLGSILKAVAVRDGMTSSTISMAEYNDPEWALKIIGGNGAVVNSAYSVTTDSDNNIYICGSFHGEDMAGNSYVDFDPNTSYDTEKGSGAFVTKINSDGTYAWTRRFTRGMALSVAVDSGNNIYVAGYFNGTCNFNDAGYDGRTARGYNDIFLTRINADGTYGWTRTMGGDSDYMYDDWAREIVIDRDDNVYITGTFAGTVDFDPGPEEDILQTIRDDSFPQGHPDAFVTKFNPDGTYGWTLAMGPRKLNEYNRAFGTAEGRSIVVDPEGNIYVAGEFGGEVDFDPTAGEDTHVSNYSLDIFVTKICANGAYGWTRAMGSVTGHCYATSLCRDKNSNLYVTGSFNGRVNFNRSGGTDWKESSRDGEGQDAFIMKLDSDGGYFWTRTIASVESFSIATDGSERIYLTGWYSRTTDFDPGSGVDERAGVIQGNMTQPFVTSLDLNGSYSWTEVYPVTGSLSDFNFNRGWHVHAAENGDVLTVGSFMSEIDFDPSTGEEKVSPLGYAGSTNVYMRRIR